MNRPLGRRGPTRTGSQDVPHVRDQAPILRQRRNRPVGRKSIRRFRRPGLDRTIDNDLHHRSSRPRRLAGFNLDRERTSRWQRLKPTYWRTEPSATAFGTGRPRTSQPTSRGSPRNATPTSSLSWMCDRACAFESGVHRARRRSNKHRRRLRTA